MAPLYNKGGAHIMLKNELIEAIQEILENAELRELELIYRILKHMVNK